MSENEKRTRRAASYPGAVAWVAANAGNESIQADPDLWAKFISDVFKRDLSEVTAALNSAVNSAEAKAVDPEPTETETTATETVDA